MLRLALAIVAALDRAALARRRRGHAAPARGSRRVDRPAGWHGTPAHIVRFRADSVLEKAGLAVGDQIVEMNGRALPRRHHVRRGDPRAARRAIPCELTARRGERTIAHRDSRAARCAASGSRASTSATALPRAPRDIWCAPTRRALSGVPGRLPVVVFIPWLSCEPVENPFGARDGWGKMLETVMRESRMQVVRIEKPGVGDSAGPDCSSTDLEDDLAAFRAGIRAALADPGVDPAAALSLRRQHRRSAWRRFSRRNSPYGASS